MRFISSRPTPHHFESECSAGFQISMEQPVSYVIKAFTTFRCDRCGCKQSASCGDSEFSYRGVFRRANYPAGWMIIDHKDFCERCAPIVTKVMSNG